MGKGEGILPRFPSDTLLESLVAFPHKRVRLWAARKAADRAMHWAALRGAPNDPYILARLGLYPLANSQVARDSQASMGQRLAALAMGPVDEQLLQSLSSLSQPKRRLAARILALHDCEAAMQLLADDDHEALAACAIALENPAQGRVFLDKAADQSRESAAIGAHIAICEGRFADARSSLNFIFAKDGLSGPLEELDAAYTIDDLHSHAPAVSDGPKISVIIPYRDAADTLASAVRSITQQSCHNLEILLVDDRSSDESPAIAETLREGDNRIIPLSNSRSPGVYGARNTALLAASGDFISFLDADDWSPAERFARQMETLGNKALAISNHIRMDEKGRPVAPRIFPVVRPVPITMLVRREIMQSAGLFEEVATGADSEMLARLEMMNGKSSIFRDPAVLLVARWRSGSLSQTKEGGMLGMERYAYRAEWMYRHAGLEALRLPAEPGAA